MRLILVYINNRAFSLSHQNSLAVRLAQGQAGMPAVILILLSGIPFDMSLFADYLYSLSLNWYT